MKRYIALLRGINISGKNKLAMPALKAAMEERGFTEVITLLNSGNVRLTAPAASCGEVRAELEELLRTSFSLDTPVYVTEPAELEHLLAAAPPWWGTEDKAYYDNLIFILTKETPQEISALIGPATEGLEKIQIFENAIFWTFDRQAYQKCTWWKKTAAKGIAEKLTIRTAGTVRKLIR